MNSYRTEIDYTSCCDGLDRQIDALGEVPYILTPVEIKIVEGVEA
jgi:hypothetical protein